MIICPRSEGRPLNLYRLPRSLLRDISGYFHIELASEEVREHTMPPGDYCHADFDLFLQWLFTKRYEEMDGRMRNGEGRYLDRIRAITDTEPSVPWRVAAGMGAVTLGIQLEAPKYQNYGMSRLFSAFSSPGLGARLNATLWEASRTTDNKRPIEPLATFYEDMLLRNCGDKSIVEGNDAFWAMKLYDKILRVKFVKAVRESLEERRKQPPLDINKYLVPED